MKKIALIFWPEEGNVEKAANIVAGEFDPSQIEKLSLSQVTEEILNNYHYFIFGGSTVGAETWREADDSNIWNSFFLLLTQVDFTHKTVAFFGLGDQILYPQHFVDGLGVFEEEFSKHGAMIVGRWPDESYEYTESEGVRNGEFFGLALDEDNESELTPERVKKWTAILKKIFD